MALITCKNITLSYNNVDVVKDMTFSIEKDECLCVIGENGSGKSTLVKALLGLKKQRTGQIIYENGLKRNQIGYLPQRSELQKDFPASVKEVVLSGRLGTHGLSPFYTKEDKKIAEYNMERLGISEIANRSFAELSGGQQQRVLLARALCATSSILLLDEPAAALDETITAELYSMIKQIRSEGITVVMVSHDIDSALKLADRVLCLSANGWYICNAGDYPLKENQNESGENADE